MRHQALNTVLLALVLAAVCQTQTSVTGPQNEPALPASRRGKFEVASIKPGAPGAARASIGMLKGRLLARNATLRELILYATQMPAVQLVGGPPWINSERFTIEATAPGLLMTAYRSLLTTLLEERFGLLTRHETREVPVYELVRIRPDGLGPELRLSTSDCTKRAADGVSPCRLSSGLHGEITATGINWDRIALAKELVDILGRPVIDKSGLQGPVDLSLKWRDPLVADGADANLPTIFTALEEQLGLKLVSTKGDVDFLVVVAAVRPMPN